MQKKIPWKTLIAWFMENGKHNFPWRQYTDDVTCEYRVWLAEILLQQTQADRVVSFYTRILEKYPTVQDLARASYEEFFPYYQGLGYYSRARNLLKTANIVSHEYQGVFPKDKTILKKLPGVGEYTSRAILAFGYMEPILAWDTNLETIFSRYYKGDKQIKLTQEEKDIIEQDMQEYIKNYPGDHIRHINNGLMDWARLMEPKNPNLLNRETYIFKESEFYISEGETEVTEKKITQYFPIPDATVVVILHEDHKSYYSLKKDTYSPFILLPSENRDTRKYIQDYFRDTYKLELSVRPVHKKWITTDGKPYIAVNAQIQAGESHFNTYTKSEAKNIINNITSL